MRKRAVTARALALLGVVAAVSGACVAGCGKGKSAGGDAKSLTLWEYMDPGERAVLDTLLTEYQAKHAGVKIVTEHFTPEEVRNQFQTAAQAGGGPEIVYGPSDNAGPFSVMQIVQPADELMPHGYLDKFLPAALDTIGGHVWQVPDQFGNHLMLMYNSALIARPPQTMDELLAMAKAATHDSTGDGTPEVYGLVFNTSEPFWLVPFLGGYGGWVMDAQAKPTLDSPAMVNALKLCARFKAEGIMPKECDYNTADGLFKEGRAAMIINGLWGMEGYLQKKLPVKVARIPQVAPGAWSAPMISGRGYYVNAHLGEGKKDLVVDLLKWLTAPENEMRYARAARTLPSRRECYEGDSWVKTDAILAGALDQATVGRRMPVAPEMRVIWDAMRPQMQSVMNGSTDPVAAAKAMQADAVQKIAAMAK